MNRYNNTLTTVIFRVDFVDEINIEDDALDKACINIYPVVQNETVHEQTVTTSFNDKGEPQVERSKKTFLNKKYSNRQLTQYLKVSPKFILTEVKDYTSYLDTRNIFVDVFKAIQMTNPQMVVSRIGMRYINQIDLTPYKKTNRKNYIKTKLYESLFENIVEGSSLARTQHLTELAIEDYRVRCVTGFFNPDYPAIIKRNIVTLDFDAFIQGNVESDEVETYLDKFHHSIQSLYEESISAKQREQMGLINDEQK